MTANRFKLSHSTGGNRFCKYNGNHRGPILQLHGRQRKAFPKYFQKNTDCDVTNQLLDAGAGVASTFTPLPGNYFRHLWTRLILHLYPRLLLQLLLRQ